jgi:hypothetical protein
MVNRLFCVIGLLLLLFTAASAQKADITVSFGEPFFDALLDSVLQNGGPEVSIGESSAACSESIKVQREINGTRSAVRFRDGHISVPIAFSGSHALPFIGCVDFAGWADTLIDLEFDRAGQRLVGRAHVQRVNLSGSGGAGGTMIANLLQNSIDRRLNPFEIVRLDRLSFAVPIQNAGGLRAQAVAVRPEVLNGQLNVSITYQFSKL